MGLLAKVLTAPLCTCFGHWCCLLHTALGNYSRSWSAREKEEEEEICKEVMVREANREDLRGKEEVGKEEEERV